MQVRARVGGRNLYEVVGVFGSECRRDKRESHRAQTETEHEAGTLTAAACR